MARIAKAAMPGTGGQGGEGRSGWQQARRQVHPGLLFRLYSDLPVFGWSPFSWAEKIWDMSQMRHSFKGPFPNLDLFRDI